MGGTTGDQAGRRVSPGRTNTVWLRHAQRRGCEGGRMQNRPYYARPSYCSSNEKFAQVSFSTRLCIKPIISRRGPLAVVFVPTLPGEAPCHSSRRSGSKGRAWGERTIRAVCSVIAAGQPCFRSHRVSPKRALEPRGLAQDEAGPLGRSGLTSAGNSRFDGRVEILHQARAQQGDDWAKPLKRVYSLQSPVRASRHFDRMSAASACHVCHT